MKKSKRITVKIMALVMALTCLCVLGETICNTKAFCKYMCDLGYIEYTGASNTVYYFSDTEETTLDEISIRSLVGDEMNIVYDIQPWISPYDFTVLVYSGYFWGFEQPSEESPTVFLLELKYLRLNPATLNDLFFLIKQQGCSVIFVSPYLNQEDYIDANFHEFTDVEMQCDMSEWQIYFDYSLLDMGERCIGEFPWSNYWLNIWENSILILDGRFLGIYEYSDNLDIKDVIVNSEFLQRLLISMKYGPFDYEDELADILLEFYGNGSAIRDIDALMQIWSKGYNYNDITNGEYDDGIFHYKNYSNYHNRAIARYFMGKIADDLASDVGNFAKDMIDNNIIIYVHIPDSGMLWDIFNFQDKFIPLIDIVNEESNPKLFAMAIYYMNAELYDVLYYIQNIEIDVIMPIYIWAVNPINWSDEGLQIQSVDTLISKYNVSVKVPDIQFPKDYLLELLGVLLGI